MLKQTEIESTAETPETFLEKMSTMSVRKLNFLGITLWLTGVTLDRILIPYAFILIYPGALLALYGVLKWILIAENRQQLLSILKTWDYEESSGNVFRRRQKYVNWKKVSIIIMGGVTLAMIGTFASGPGGEAYRTAAIAVRNDDQVINRAGEIIQFSTLTSSDENGSKANFEIGVIGKKSKFWVKVSVDKSTIPYKTTSIVIE